MEIAICGRTPLGKKSAPAITTMINQPTNISNFAGTSSTVNGMNAARSRRNAADSASGQPICGTAGCKLEENTEEPAATEAWLEHRTEDHRGGARCGRAHRRESKPGENSGAPVCQKLGRRLHSSTKSFRHPSPEPSLGLQTGGQTLLKRFVHFDGSFSVLGGP